MTGPSIVWLRRDLRLRDNPALYRAAALGPVLPVYIHAPEEEGNHATGAAGAWWLHCALRELQQELKACSSRLLILRGEDSLAVLRRLIRDTDAAAVFWNRRYEPAGIQVDRRVKAALREDGIRAESFPGNLLREPWEVQRKDGGSFRAFTPFWRASHRLPPPATPLPAPQLEPPAHWPDSLEPDELELLPRIPWYRGFESCWQPGEQGANTALDIFVRNQLSGYAGHRDLPGTPGTSRLSPHLHFGELSPRQVWAAVHASRQYDSDSATTFLSELGWREFAHHLLYYHPQMPDTPLDRRFEEFPWAEEQEGPLQTWQQGQTGIPIVDAGMRELWHTGWMHNRVRMIVGSLLTKNLRIPWQRGERWFRDTLVDADLASNSMGWQWVQGCGADAAPYFRIFNPVRQGERFDPDGTYVRRWVPELARLPTGNLHAPWDASVCTLRKAGVTLGETYPEPLVDLGTSRKAALDAYQTIRNG